MPNLGTTEDGNTRREFLLIGAGAALTVVGLTLSACDRELSSSSSSQEQDSQGGEGLTGIPENPYLVDPQFEGGTGRGTTSFPGSGAFSYEVTVPEGWRITEDGCETIDGASLRVIVYSPPLWDGSIADWRDVWLEYAENNIGRATQISELAVDEWGNAWFSYLYNPYDPPREGEDGYYLEKDQGNYQVQCSFGPTSSPRFNEAVGICQSIHDIRPE